MSEPTLFEHREPYRPRDEGLRMSLDFLIAWKSRIAEYQRGVREGKGVIEQTTLFDLPKTTWHTADEIDPFALKRCPSDFYDMPPRYFEPPDDTNQGCIYFQIDHVAGIILYIGETKLNARQRWVGQHYCKGYVLNYIELHRRYDLDLSVSSAFWYHTKSKKSNYRSKYRLG